MENTNYSDKFKKAAAYDVEKLKVIGPHSNRDEATTAMRTRTIEGK